MSVLLAIPRGLEGEREGNTKVYQGRARSATRGEPETAVEEELDEDDLVEIHWEDGAIVVVRAERLAHGRALPGGRGTRDPLGMAIVRLVLRPAVDRGVSEILGDLDARFLAELPPEAREPDGVLREWGFDEETWVPLREGRPGTALLLVHGTFATTAETFGDYMPGAAAAMDWATILGRYDRVLAFDHPTLTRDPVENLERLVALLPADLTLTVLAHSRGGLIGELLAVALAGDPPKTGSEGARLHDRITAAGEALAGKNVTLRRIVRVACPVQGTTLMSQGLDDWLNMSLNAIGLIPSFRASPVFGLVRELLLAVAASRRDADVAPGLEVMSPKSPFVRWLAACRGAGELVAVTGESGGGTVVRRLADVVAGVVFPDRHDLVVDTAAMVGGAERPEGDAVVRPILPDRDRLDHFHYFRHPRCRDVLKEALDPRADATPSRRRAATSGGAPKVLFLPDVFASRLVRGSPGHAPTAGGPAGGSAARSGAAGGPVGASAAPSGAAGGPVGGSAAASSAAGGPVGGSAAAYPDAEGAVATGSGVRPTVGAVLWPSVASLAGGGLDALLAGDVVADGPVDCDALVAGLGPAWTVGAWPWVWTRPLAAVAADLDAALAADVPEVIIAHGVAGWILDLARRANGPGWQAFAADGRIVLLGVPRLGAWWAWELLTGRGAMFDVLSRLGGPDTLAGVRRIPALWAMLPDPPAPGSPARAAWSLLRDPPDRSWLVPDRDLLGRDWRRVLTLSGTAPGTPGVPGSDAPIGDGRVPRSSSTSPPGSGGTDRFSTEPHGRLGTSAGDLTLLSRWLDGVGALQSVVPEVRGPGRGRRDGSVQAKNEVVPPLPSARELLEVALDAAPPGRGPALRVEVAHGDPALLTHDRVVVVGHPDLARLTRIEVDLDRALGGTLGERLRVGRFPQALGTFTVAVPGPRHLANRPRAVLALGLGRAGTITRVRMIEAIEEALVECALPPISSVLWPDAASSERRLAFSLVGVGRAGLLPEEGAECILEAVVRANERMRREGVGAPYTHLLLVELAGCRAKVALSRALLWATHPNVSGVTAADVHVHPILGVGQGPQDWLPEYDDESLPRGRTQRLTVRTASQEDDVVRLEYDSTQELAAEGSSARTVRWNDVIADLEAIVASNGWAPSAILGLRNGLLPPRLVDELREGLDLDLSLDRRAAALPWEAFVAAYDGEDDPLASRISILRRLRNVTPITLAPIGNGRALVVCAAGSGATFLPGAGPEADAVSDALTSGGYEVVRVGGSLSAIYAALAEKFEIVHLIGHGVHVPGRPDKTGFLAEDGRIFSVWDAERFEHNVPALFFFNACHLGRMDGTDLVEGPGSIAAGFAEVAIRVGARAVVAAGWPVGDEGAVAFARAFYREMLEPSAYRTAVAEARVRCREASPADGTWAAYQCYGDPEFVLPSRLAVQMSSESWSDKAIAAAPVRSARDARDILGRLHRRGQLLDPKEDRVRLEALQRVVDDFIDRLPPEISVDDLDLVAATADPKQQRDRLRKRFKEVLPQAPERTAPSAEGFGGGDLESMLRPLGDPTKFQLARQKTMDLIAGGGAAPAEVAALWRDVRIGLTNRQASDLASMLGDVVRTKTDRATELGRALQATDTSLLDDPNYLRFGTSPDWGLEARFLVKHGFWYDFELRLTARKDSPAARRAIVSLHPTFKNPRRTIELPPMAAGETRCLLPFSAWGAFTIGVEIDDARMEIDLLEFWPKKDEDPARSWSGDHLADLVAQRAPDRPFVQAALEIGRAVRKGRMERTPDAPVRKGAAEGPPDDEAGPAPAGDASVEETASLLRDRSADADVETLLVAGRRALVSFALDPNAAKDPALSQLAAVVQPLLDRIAKGEAIPSVTDEQRKALSAFNLLVTRPALVVRNDAVLVPPAWKGLDVANPKMQRQIRAVGRVEQPDRRHAGTGFLIEKTAILTNNHVVCALMGKPLDFWKKRWDEYVAAVDAANLDWADGAAKGPGFERWAEDGNPKSARVRILGVRTPLMKDADYAVLELASKPKEAEIVELAIAGIDAGKDLYAVGCPGDAFPKNWLPPEIQALLFGPQTTLGTKRLSPGRVMRVDADVLRHDASTLAGSSGSCVVDLATHRVVGIHSSGFDPHASLDARNQAVALWKHRDDPLLAKATWK